MKQLTAAIVVLVVLAGISCGLLAVFLDGSLLPYKPCRPVMYLGETTSASGFAIDTPDYFTEVLAFYDQHLSAKPVPVDMGHWGKKKLTDNLYLYKCAAADLNGLTGETGCIYVAAAGATTRVKGLLLRSEGDGWPCPNTLP